MTAPADASLGPSGTAGARASRAVAAAAACIAAVQGVITTGRSTLGVVACALAVAALAHRGRVRVGSAGEVLAALVLGGLGTALHGLSPEQNGLGSAPLRSAMFVFAFTGLAMAALRLHLERPEGGLPGTLAAASLVFLACGTVRSGPWLPRTFALFVALALVAIALDAWERGRAPAPWRMRGRHAVVVLVLALAVPGLMWGWGRTGPKLIRSATTALLDLFDPVQRTGFHDGPIALHALDGLKESDEVVLRVDGRAGEHLRGNVYLTYDQGRWVPAPAPAPGEIDPIRLAPRPPADAPVARIEYASAETPHFFLPLGAKPHAIEPPAALVDPWQLVRADEAKPSTADIAWPDSAAAEPAPPDARDLFVPESLRAPLEQLLGEGLAGPAHGPAARARALERMLQRDFEYTTRFREDWVEARRARPTADPVLLFLEDFRRGHCEYFASALALLLRADGTPARFVSGYRIAERNPLGGWAVVRKRHAHTWVEAYLPDVGWTTLDGTPIAAATAVDGLSETQGMAAVFDWVARQLRVHGRMVLLVVLVVGLAIAQIVRLVRGRVGAAGRRDDSRRAARALRRMLDRLAEAGFSRARGETLESLARRLRQPGDRRDAARSWPEPAMLEAADLLDRYAALRYGDVGRRRDIESTLASWPEPPAEVPDSKRSSAEG